LPRLFFSPPNFHRPFARPKRGPVFFSCRRISSVFSPSFFSQKRSPPPAREAPGERFPSDRRDLSPPPFPHKRFEQFFNFGGSFGWPFSCSRSSGESVHSLLPKVQSPPPKPWPALAPLLIVLRRCPSDFFPPSYDYTSFLPAVSDRVRPFQARGGLSSTPFFPVARGFL